MLGLAGDIGGTHARLRLVDLGEDSVIAEQGWSTRDLPDFEDVVAAAIEGFGPRKPGVACLAVAGPVRDERVEMTNASWVVDARSLERRFGFDVVRVVNDFRALGESVADLTAADVRVIREAETDPRAPRAVLGAGTGLGEAIVVPAGDDVHVIETEGGHTDFAPNDDVQAALLTELRSRYGHVSWERILSGDGLVEVYRFFAERGRALVDVDTTGSASQVAERWRKHDPVARDAVGLFIDVFGAEAGNLALKCLARGGVFLAGGMAAKNPEWFEGGRFDAAFTAKGRFSGLMKTIPVRLVINESAGLVGATRIARRIASGV